MGWGETSDLMQCFWNEQEGRWCHVKEANLNWIPGARGSILYSELTGWVAVGRQLVLLRLSFPKYNPSGLEFYLVPFRVDIVSFNV